jgi:tetratricopeptide (TPR) repeat protein
MQKLFAVVLVVAATFGWAPPASAQIISLRERPMAAAGRDDGPWLTCLNEEHTISLERAIDACSRLIGSTPYRTSRAYALRLRAHLHEDQGAADLATTDYQSALELYSQAANGVRPDANAYEARGVVYYELGQYDLALADFVRSIEIEHDNASGFFNRAMILFRRGDYAGAFADFEQAARLNARTGSSYIYDLGRCIGGAGAGVDLDRAWRFCNRSVSRSNGAAIALTARGYLLFTQGQFEQAASDFARAVEDDPYDATAVYGRGVTSIRLGRQSEGQADIDRAREMHSLDVDFYANAGMTP